jgi:hypothetical protein
MHNPNFQAALMLQRIPVLSNLGGVFQKRHPRQQAGLALSRLLTQFDLGQMPYESGSRPSRRADCTRNVAIGIWLIPFEEGRSPENVDLHKAIPAATCDMRRQGIGVLMPVKLAASRFLAAVADPENVWRFFVVTARHVTDRPGGWFQIGLSVEAMYEPDSLQTLRFRQRVENAFRE